MAFPQPIFQVRGTALKPYYSRGSSAYRTVKQAAGSADATVEASAVSGVFGGSLIAFGTTRTELMYRGYENWTETGAFSILIRILPSYSGAPAATQNWVNFGDDNYRYMSGCTISHRASGLININLQNGRGSTIVSGTFANAPTIVSGTVAEFLITFTGAQGTNAVKCYQCDAAAGTLTDLGGLTPAGNSVTPWDNLVLPTISFAAETTAAQSFKVNELTVWNSVITYEARTTFVASLNRWGDELPAQADTRLSVHTGLNDGTYDGSDRWSDPGESNVRDGVTYKGNSLTDNKEGTLEIPGASIDPGEDNVKLGTVYQIEGDSKTGTLESTDPGESNVTSGTQYIIESVAKTGTRDVVTNVMTGPRLRGTGNSAKLRGNRNE